MLFIHTAVLLYTVLGVSLSKNCNKFRELYTECGESSSDRWKVYVTDEKNCTVPDPVKVANCDKTCPGGEYLQNMSTCIKCLPGTYSLGDKLEYPVLDSTLYPEVNNVSTKINMHGAECGSISIKEGLVEIPPDLCWYVITLPVTVLKPGVVKVEYHLPDSRVYLLFNLKSSTESCGGTAMTSIEAEHGYSWQTIELVISQKGSFVIEIKSTSYFSTELHSDQAVPIEPAHLGKVSVTGVKPPTNCKACPKGYIAPTAGTDVCRPCSPGTYSESPTKCTPCTSSQYSTSGARECSQRVTCEEREFTPVVGSCMEGKSKVTAVSLTPNKCSNSLPSQIYDCQVCQPGTEQDSKKCNFCKDGSHNKNGTKCEPCLPNTISLKGLYYVWWSSLPDTWTSRCASDTKCWIPVGPFLLAQSESDQPIALAFGEVKFSSKSITSKVVGLFNVEFELECPGTCAFYLIRTIQYLNNDNEVYEHRSIVKSYEDSTNGRTVALYEILNSENDPSGLPWKFSIQLSGVGAYIKIFILDFTNTAVGGARYCFPCKGGSECLECALGSIEKDGQCVTCPPNTYHMITGSILSANYTSKCLKCPHDTVSAAGSTSCYTSCDLVTSSHASYDLSSLSEDVVYDQPDSYPDNEGHRFHYRYKKKLCSTDGEVPEVVCREDGGVDNVRSQICQVNVMSDREGNETTSHPVSKGDTLNTITEQDNGLVLEFVTLHSTADCGAVTTSVTLICARDRTGDVRLVRNEVCSLDFEYSGPFGCKKCTAAEYKSITSACVEGRKNTTYVWLPDIVCAGGVQLPMVTMETCTVYEDTLVNSLIRFKMYVGLGVVSVILMCGGICFLAVYTNSLKHKLDGYTQMKYGLNNDYLGHDNNATHWNESEEEDEDEDVYSKPSYKPPTPGNLLIQKISDIKRMGLRKYNNVDHIDLLKLSNYDEGSY